MSTSESLTTMPLSASRPNTERMLTGRPNIKWPNRAPMMPKGMTDMMASGLV